jgi:2-oxoglutarate dehydrogenase E2 component (dihydrolipoamide succinyltransferase)
VARIDAGGAGGAAKPPAAAAASPATATTAPAANKTAGGGGTFPEQGAPIKDTGKHADIPSGGGQAAPGDAPPVLSPTAGAPRAVAADELSPAVRRMVEENKLNPAAIAPSGPGGRITKEDVQKHLDARSGATPGEREADPADANGDAPPLPRAAAPSVVPAGAATPAEGAGGTSTTAGASQSAGTFDEAGVKRVPMSKIRKKIAERLVAAQQTAAILTTFNEVDLSAVMALRAKYKEKFNETHGVGLGLMSFFCRAAVRALREFPRVNAQISGDDLVYFDYVHLGIAVSTERGLAVPVLRNVESMSFAKIESEIKRLAAATRDGKLGIHELSGGTFTITNGGVFGSLLSTPILNPPQSGILGMHTIQKRPVAVGDKVEVHPMMYVALSYDHRVVDGRESVSFLVRMKELLEDPARLMLEI